jgi:hypothetical protein
MPSANAAIHSLNSGEVSRLALARVDLAKMRLACEQQENLLPKVLGPARMRPGSANIAETASSANGVIKEFVFSAATKALLELTPNILRIYISDVLLTRPTVTAVLLNGDFATNLASWTDSDEAGAASSWLSGGMLLTGTGSNFAIREQTVAVVQPGVEHALRITVSRGRATLKVGTSAGADDYIAQTTLRTGVHSIAFTPNAGNFAIWIGNQYDNTAVVDSILLESAGVVALPTPWGSSDLVNYRQKQSGDVMFVACAGVQQRRIERRSQRSWSVVLFDPSDGPFRPPNSSSTTLAPSAVSGSITLTASRNTFRTGHVGALFKLIHSGQKVTDTLAGASQYTDDVRVSGLVADRGIYIDIGGTFVGTVTLQRSLGAPGSWTDVSGAAYTGATSVPYNDNLDNQIIYYRLGINPGDYTSGSADVALTYANSSQVGIVRVTDFVSATSVLGDVLAGFGTTDATVDWQEGKWSTYRGFPSSLDIHDGRLIFGGNDEIIASVSDAYESFDDEVEGDSAPIIRSIATGSFDSIYWILSLQRLLVGTASQEVSIRSSSFDEPLTPTKFTARKCSSRGNANVQAIAVDSAAIFVQRNKRGVFELKFSSEGGDYAAADLTRLKPEICQAGVVSMAIQRQPDTRIWHVLADGTVAILTYERADEVVAWTKFSMSNGLVKSVAVLPGDDEDEIYLLVSRVIGGVTKYYVEKLAKESEVVGGSLNKVMDGHVVYSGGSTTTISGLSHLNGLQVVVWAGGAPLVTQDAMLTVSGGSVTLPSAVTSCVVGLPYSGKLKSAKLSYAAGGGSALAQKQRLDHVALLMADVGWKGVRIGRDFDNMTGLSSTYKGKALTAAQVLTAYDYDASGFNGGWDTDSRLCVEVKAPYPATLLAAVISIATNDVPASRQSRSSSDAG